MAGINSLASGLSALFGKAGATFNNVMMNFHSTNPSTTTPNQADTALMHMTSKIALDPIKPIYEEDVHKNLTQVLAWAAGYSGSEAEAIANGNQGIDDNPGTSPMGMKPWGEDVRVREQFHFTTEARRTEMWQQFERTNSAPDLGAFLHAQQDSFSHDGYGARFGHLSAGHAPDKTFKDVAKADRMAEDSFNFLQKAFAHSRRSGYNSNLEPVSWNVIKDSVHKFNSATTNQNKDKYIQEIIKTVHQYRAEKLR